MKIVSVEKSYPPRAGGCKVAVYSAPPERPYERVALLQVSGERDKARAELPTVKEESCALGGDAVVLPSLASDPELVSGVRHGQAEVIRFVRARKVLSARRDRAPLSR